MQPFRALLATTAATLALCPTAFATVATTTTMTSPADGSTAGLVAFDENTGRYPLTVTGTSDGTSGAVDVQCYYLNAAGAVSRAVLAANVAVGADGAFSTVANGQQLSYHPCTILAVPATTNPVDLTPFHGVRARIALDKPFRQSGGPNDGKLYDYYASASFTRGYGDFDSVSSCGIDDALSFAAVPASGLQQESKYTFYCNGYYFKNASTSSGVYRSGVRVDGNDAYGAAAAQSINANGAWIPLTYAASYDAAAGRMTITETDSMVSCPANVAPAQVSMANCPSFTDAHLAVDRTQVISSEGTVISQTDTWRSTGGARAVDLLEEQDFQANNSWFEFPGQAAFAKHTTPYETVAVPDPGKPASVLYALDASAPAGVTNPRASITSWPVPDAALFASNASKSYYAHYAFMVPASGSVVIRKVYATEITTEALAPLTATAEDSVAGPAVALTAPADGATVNTPTVTVTGTATDNTAVTSLTVNGQAATVSSGTFTKDVTLAEGANTITVAATDATGNTATATRSVTYVKPVVAPPAITPKAPTIGADGTIACPAGGAACTATLTATTTKAFAAAKKRRRVVGGAKLTIAAGKSGKPVLKLSKYGKRLLRAHGKLRLRLVTTARAGTGKPVTATRVVTIRAPKRAHKKH